MLVTCDPGNVASRRVIEANGGTLASVPCPDRPNDDQLLFWIGTAG